MCIKAGSVEANRLFPTHLKSVFFSIYCSVALGSKFLGTLELSDS